MWLAAPLFISPKESARMLSHVECLCVAILSYKLLCGIVCETKSLSTSIKTISHECSATSKPFDLLINICVRMRCEQQMTNSQLYLFAINPRTHLRAGRVVVVLLRNLWFRPVVNMHRLCFLLKTNENRFTRPQYWNGWYWHSGSLLALLASLFGALEFIYLFVWLFGCARAKKSWHPICHCNQYDLYYHLITIVVDSLMLLYSRSSLIRVEMRPDSGLFLQRKLTPLSLAMARIPSVPYFMNIFTFAAEWVPVSRRERERERKCEQKNNENTWNTKFHHRSQIDSEIRCEASRRLSNQRRNACI